MLQSAFKLFCLGLALFGPFAAGILFHYVHELPLYLIFAIGFSMAGFGGICGFASVEREEAARHQAALGKKG